jgi:hypothetical protein
MATSKKRTTAKTSAPKASAEAATRTRTRNPGAAKPVAAKHAQPDKIKKPKLVRDSFTIPKAEYAVLDELKQRAALSGLPAKKSEILRGGIMALAALSDSAFLAAIRAVPPIKTGRPAKQ